MQITAVLLHKGSLAHYTLSDKEYGDFQAHLLRYSGKRRDAPPQRVCFVKDGRYCTGDTGEQEIMDELCAAVKLEQERRNEQHTRMAA